MEEPTTPQNDISPNELKLRKLDNRDRLMRAFEAVVLAIVVIITMFGLLNVRQLAKDNRLNIEEHRYQIEDVSGASKDQVKAAATENRARLDVINCIISVAPTVRTPEYVKSCYDLVDQKHGIKVERFGDGK